MCGIIHIKRTKNKPAHLAVAEAYNKQKARGSEGFGYVAVSKDGSYSVQRAETEKEIMKLLRRETAPEILFHHRMPTSTANLDFCAHPILVSNPKLKYDYLVVHNGVISNHAKLSPGHKQEGFSYTTEHEIINVVRYKGRDIAGTGHHTKYNDSESLAIEVAMYVEGLKNTMDFEGTAAIMFYQIDKTTNRVHAFWYGRNSGNPLGREVIKHKKGEIIKIASVGGTAIENGYLVKVMEGKPIAPIKVDIGQSYKAYHYAGWTGHSEPPAPVGFGRREESVTRPLLPPLKKPQTSDFSDKRTYVSEEESSDYAMHADEIRKLEEKIEECEVEMEMWREELLNCGDNASIEALRQEIKEIEIKYNDLQEKLDVLNESIPSIYTIQSE